MKKLIYLAIIAALVYVAVFYAGPIIGDMISGRGGINIDLSSIPLIGEKFGGPSPPEQKPITETPEVTVLKVEEGPGGAPPPAQPTPVPTPTRVPPTPVSIGERVDSVVGASVEVLEGGQTIIQEISQTKEVTEDAAGFPICTGAAVFLFGGLIIKLTVNLIKKLYKSAEDLLTGKILTSMFAMIITAGLLFFQAWQSYKSQGLSYLNPLILSVIPFAVFIIGWEQLVHKGFFEKIRVEIGEFKPLIFFSRLVEIAFAGVYAVGGEMQLLTAIADAIADWPMIGLLSPSITTIAQARTATVEAQGWFSSVATSDALLGLLGVFVILFVVMTGGGSFYREGHYSEPPGEMALERSGIGGLFRRRNRD